MRWLNCEFIFKQLANFLFSRLLSHNYRDTLRNLFEKTVNGLSYEFVCDLNAPDSKCRTCLHLAVEHGHFDVVSVLLKLRLQLYSTDPINGQLATAEIGSPFLLDTYAEDGRTPLMVAVCNCHQKIAE